MQEEIIQFADNWIEKFSNPKSTGYDLCDDISFGSGCKCLCFEIDNGEKLKSFYGINSYEEVIDNLYKISDIMALGSAIYSYWRYFNHWSYSAQDILEHKDWFIKSLSRLKELAKENN